PHGNGVRQHRPADDCKQRDAPLLVPKNNAGKVGPYIFGAAARHRPAAYRSVYVDLAFPQYLAELAGLSGAIVEAKCRTHARSRSQGCSAKRTAKIDYQCDS